jgi:6-pyruvoyltetrahydropterin/6-carboxytetrahydropterin synthase
MSTATVTRKFSWEMGHRLPQHSGRCRRLHGHSYICEVDVTGEVKAVSAEQSDAGMVVDFYQLKEALNEAVGVWDHRMMLWEKDPLLKLFSEPQQALVGIITVPFMPTAENIALEIMRRLNTDSTLSAYAITRVRVYETTTGWAEVRQKEAE